MRISLPLLLAATLGLGACASARDSAFNPSNWFGRASAEAATDGAAVNPLIPQNSEGIFARRTAEADAYAGRPIDEITNLTVERIQGGAIIRATGRATRQGVHAVRLTPLTVDETPIKGVLTYRLEGVLPARATPTGAAATREGTAARQITDQELRGVRTIRVEGVRNARVTRR